MDQYHVAAEDVMTLAAGSIEDPDCKLPTGMLAEASTIGLAPGVWPQVIAVDTDDVTRLFEKVHETIHPQGGLIAVDYALVGEAGSFRLTVLND